MVANRVISGIGAFVKARNVNLKVQRFDFHILMNLVNWDSPHRCVLVFRRIMSKRFKIEIEYKGTNFSGWQIQPNAHTVEGG